MLDDRVRAVLARLEEVDAGERAQGLPSEQRSRQVARTTGQFLFSLVSPQADCSVLEIGGSRGYSTIWLAAGVRYLGGSVVSLEHDPPRIEAWQANIAEAGLEDWAHLIPGDALETLPALDDVFDVVFLDAEKEQYEELFQLARAKLEPAALGRRRQRPLPRRAPRRLLRRRARQTRPSRASPSRSIGASSSR